MATLHYALASSPIWLVVVVIWLVVIWLVVIWLVVIMSVFDGLARLAGKCLITSRDVEV